MPARKREKCLSVQNSETVLRYSVSQFQDLVAQLDEAAVRRLALELLRRQPAAFADLVDGELANPANEQVPSQPNPNSMMVQIGAFVVVMSQCQHKKKTNVAAIG